MSEGLKEEELLTVAQVALRLRVCVRTVRSWVATQQLGHIRLGAKFVRIPLSEVACFLEANLKRGNHADRERYR